MPVGLGAMGRTWATLLKTPDLPVLARKVCTDLADRLRAVDERIAGYDQLVDQLASQTESTQQLMQVPGVAPVTTTALVATVGTAHAFRNRRRGGAWSPDNIQRRPPTAGPNHKARRCLPPHGVDAWRMRRHAEARPAHRCHQLLGHGAHARRGFNKAVVALVVKQARLLWAMLVTGVPISSPREDHPWRRCPDHD